MHEVAQYRDSSFLNDYYADLLAGLNRRYGSIINRLRTSNEPAHILWNNSCPQDRTILSVMQHVRLIDAKIIHHVYTQAHRKHIIICAGSAHIEAVAPVFERLGYRKVAQTL